MKFIGVFEGFEDHKIPFLVNDTLAIVEGGGEKAPSLIMLETKAVIVMERATIARPIRA